MSDLASGIIIGPNRNSTSGEEVRRFNETAARELHQTGDRLYSRRNSYPSDAREQPGLKEITRQN